MPDDDVTITGEIRDKLIEAKRRGRGGAAAHRRHRRSERDRLPPGQKLVRDWPVLDLGAEPNVTPQRFRLDIDGAVREPAEPDARRIHGAAADESVSDIHCVTQWSRYDNHWQGVPRATLLAIVLPKRRHGTSYSTPTTATRPMCGWSSSISRTCSWCTMGGQAADRAHGGPVRMLMPRLYFWKSAKWLRRIEFTISDQPGFWEQRGYHNNGDPWLEERYD